MSLLYHMFDKKGNGVRSAEKFRRFGRIRCLEQADAPDEDDCVSARNHLERVPAGRFLQLIETQYAVYF